MTEPLTQLRVLLGKCRAQVAGRPFQMVEEARVRQLCFVIFAARTAIAAAENNDRGGSSVAG